MKHRYAPIYCILYCILQWMTSGEFRKSIGFWTKSSTAKKSRFKLFSLFSDQNENTYYKLARTKENPQPFYSTEIVEFKWALRNPSKRLAGPAIILAIHMANATAAKKIWWKKSFPLLFCLGGLCFYHSARAKLLAKLEFILRLLRGLKLNEAELFKALFIIYFRWGGQRGPFVFVYSSPNTFVFPGRWLRTFG